MFALGSTLYLALFAPGAAATATAERTAALTMLTVACGLLVFVIP